MKRTYKLIASRGNEIVFDDRIQSDTPRNARRELKKLLGLKSLSGIVYSITEIPVDLIREIVDGELLAVVVYRKGAVAISDMLMRMRFSKEAEDAA